MSGLFTIDGESCRARSRLTKRAGRRSLERRPLKQYGFVREPVSTCQACRPSMLRASKSTRAKIDMSQLNLDFSNIKLNLDGAQPDIKTDVLTQGIMNIMGAYPS